MLIILSGYTQLMSCYSDETQLEVSQMQNLLIIHLYPTGNEACNKFPTAVNIQILFTRSDRDTQIVVTDFDYKTTKQIHIQVADITKYFDLKAAQVEIRSYNEFYIQQISEITLTRSRDSVVFNNLTVTYDQTIFEATANFPSSFTSISITAATLVVSNYLQSYTINYDNSKVVVDATAKTISLEFPNSTLSPILYDTGITTIELICTYGSNDIEAIGHTSTHSLAYKNQPDPGEVTILSAYGNDIFLILAPSEYFKAQLKLAQRVQMGLAFNDQTCTLVTQIETALLTKNIDTKGKLQLGLGTEDFQNVTATEMQPQECLAFIFASGVNAKISISLYKDNIAINRFVFQVQKIRKTCFFDVKMTLLDSNLKVTANDSCGPRKSTRAKLTLALYKTRADQLLDVQTALSSIDFLLNGNINVSFSSISADEIEAIKDAYNYRIQLNRLDGEFIDSLYPDFDTVTLLEIIIFNVIIVVCSVVATGVFGGLNIFYKKKQMNRKKLKIKIEMDEF
ncbi:uncharacterized protein SS50377_28799 [Spironucleus salmonicida]|uniref:Transmembrane protein n=1 Tax=Spironucleus salmonicida TaxID=348837 RepID=V6M3R4_9EUKA|nr:hypothetical protein SS50377_28799 [Spironucleus salmonicida]|eukprot:EST47944.1 Hypothetical protein SS50377_11926 [Spironucleus salmonicida]